MESPVPVWLELASNIQKAANQLLAALLTVLFQQPIKHNVLVGKVFLGEQIDCSHDKLMSTN